MSSATRRLVGIVGGLLLAACSGGNRSADDDDDDAGSGGTGGAVASGGSGGSGGTGGAGGSGGSAVPDRCAECIQASDCSTGFCSGLASSDLATAIGVETPSVGRCAAPGDVGDCNCVYGTVTGDSICFGDCPAGDLVLFCEHLSGAGFELVAPVTPVCPAGEASLLTEPVCVSYYDCTVRAACADVADRVGCESTFWETLATATCYPEAQASIFPLLCETARRDTAATYPSCAP